MEIRRDVTHDSIHIDSVFYADVILFEITAHFFLIAVFCGLSFFLS